MASSRQIAHVRVVIKAGVFPGDLFIFLTPNVFLVQVASYVAGVVVARRVLRCVVSLPKVRRRIGRTDPLIVARSMAIRRVRCGAVQRGAFKVR